MSLDIMKQALEALEMVTVDAKTTPNAYEASRQAITALRAAIEQAQDPVAWVGPSWLNPETRGWESESFAPKPIKGWIPLYIAPRQWQGLTDEEIKIIWRDIDGSEGMLMRFARAIETKLKEKNT